MVVASERVRFVFCNERKYTAHYTLYLTLQIQHETRPRRYAVARLGAFSNVWWSLANEFDFIFCKQKGLHASPQTFPAWDTLGETLLAEDAHDRPSCPPRYVSPAKIQNRSHGTYRSRPPLSGTRWAKLYLPRTLTIDPGVPPVFKEYQTLILKTWKHSGGGFTQRRKLPRSGTRWSSIKPGRCEEG